MFVGAVRQPEWVVLAGSIHIVTQVAQPQDSCIPTDPCKSVPTALYTNLLAVSGVGQTTAGNYVATGANSVQTVSTLPGGFSVPVSYRLAPVDPCPSCAPLSLQVNYSVVLSSTGQLLQAAAPGSLVSLWKGEGDALDAQGLNPGTLGGTAAFVAGRVGQAFSFGSAGWVDVPDSASLEPAAVTAMAWVRSSGPGIHSHALAKGGGSCQASYALYAGPNSPTTAGLFFYIYDGVNYYLSPDAGTGIWDGQWHLVAGAYDGAAVRLYVDGVQVGSGAPVATSIKYNLAEHRRLYIGKYEDSSCGLLAFNGDVDEARIYSRALTASEIQSVYLGTQ